MPYLCQKIEGKTAKILIDSGSNKNFISPDLIPLTSRKKCPVTTVTNSKGKHKINECYYFDIFGKKNVKFYVFKFHKFFDGILGYETLSSLQCHIDTREHKLIFPNNTVPLSIKHLGLPDVTLNAHTVQKVKIPVNHKNGDVFLEKKIKILDCEISPGLYKSKNGFITALVTNFGGEVKFVWTRPAEVHQISNTIELNCSISDESETNSIPIKTIETLIRTEHLNSEEKAKLLQILQKNSQIIHNEKTQLSCTTSIKHCINTTDEIPIHTKTYRYPYIHRQEVERQINEMLAEGIIQHSISPWTSPIWIVPKKSDASKKQKWRIVIDYRKLNDKTIDDKYPIPNIEEILDRLGRSCYFTTLDLKSGFHQIEVEPKDRPKTAFSTEKGHFEFIRMPFGLKNAPSTFQRAMNSILNELIGKCCLVYLDDIIIFGSSLQQHMENLNKVLTKLARANLKIQLDKCEFLRKDCEFLGHIVTQDGIKPNPNKTEKILNWPIPKTTKQIKGFLGILGYYRKFIKDFAKLTKPLTKCLKKDAKIIHSEEFISCFSECKQLLTSDPLLKYPDFNNKFILETDASDFALGAVLSQKFEDNKEHPIAYASRTLNDTECKYSATEKELLAIIFAIKHFRPYLFGKKFEIRTDHKPLVWLRQKKDLNSKLLRWKLELEAFEFDIKYKKGTLNNNADALSRIEINANTNSDEMTQHSADTDDNEFIPATERPLNVFKNQIILETSNEDSTIASTLFTNYHRIVIKRHVFTPAILINILKEYTSTRCANGINCSEKILATLQMVYKNYFSRVKSFRIFWAPKMITDITDELEQNQIIQVQHEANHRGITETSKHIARSYFFPNIKSKVTKFINLCKLCLKSKYERHPYKQKYKFTDTPTKPLQIVHMDIFIIREKNYLTFCDKFSRLAMAIPTKTRNTVHILKSLTRFIATLGKPNLLIMDNESTFTSTVIRSFLEENTIEYHYTSIAQSSSNGTVEIVHRTLRELHNILSNKETTKHYPEATKMNLAVAIYNDSIHTQINMTPRELFYGTKYDTPIPENMEDRIAQKEKLYKEIYNKSIETKQQTLNKLNKNREEYGIFNENDTVYERNRNNLKHQERYKETKVRENKETNIIDQNQRKLHKTKLKRKRKK